MRWLLALLLSAVSILGQTESPERVTTLVIRDEAVSQDKLAYVFSDPEAGHWIELSAVGFNDAKTVAVVHIGHRACGGRCAGGSFAVLEEKNGKWQPLRWKGSVCAWGS